MGYSVTAELVYGIEIHETMRQAYFDALQDGIDPTQIPKQVFGLSGFSAFDPPEWLEQENYQDYTPIFYISGSRIATDMAREGVPQAVTLPTQVRGWDALLQAVNLKAEPSWYLVAQYWA
jgi:hypothetical protein